MLKERQKLILEFCQDGKTSSEIADRIGLAQRSIYHELKALQNLNLLEKRNDGDRFKQPAIFVTIGTSAQIEQCGQEGYDPELVNIEFIKHSHNIWRQAA